MRDRALASLAVLGTIGVVISLPPAAGVEHAQAAATRKRPAAHAPTLRRLPRTSWGDPDLQAVWNYATLTPLERPAALAGKEVLTEEEAAAYKKQMLERRDATNSPGDPEWWDAGTTWTAP